MPTSTPRSRFTLLVLAAAVFGAAAVACAPGLPRSAGKLVYDGMPEIAPDPRARPYLETRSASFADWDEQGRGLYVVTRFAEAAQLHHVAAPLAMRRQLTFTREPISSAAAWTGTDANKGVVYKKDVGGNEAWQYYFLDRNTGETRLVTDGTSRNDGWLAFRGLPGMPGTSKAVFTSTRRNGRDGDLYVVEGAAPGAPRMVAQVKGRVYPLSWSSDGKLVLVLRYVQITETYLDVLDVAKGTLTPLDPAPPPGKIGRGTARFSPVDADVVYYTSDEGGEFRGLYKLQRSTGKKELLTPSLRWDVKDVELSPDGSTLVYVVNEGGASSLYAAPLATPADARRIPIPQGVISKARFEPLGSRLAFTMSGPTVPMDTFTLDVKTREIVRWTESEVGGLDPKRFVAPELLSFKSFDGREIPAWYYRAPGSGPDRKAPVVVTIHGGPESQATAYFSPYTQYLASELGIAVLVPNVRGSAGYGKTYVRLDDGMKREESVKDIGALLDSLKARPELDATRVAVLGGSYGGYMVLASMVHYAERLRCGVDVVGISNFVTFLKNTKAYRRDLRRVEYGDERDPAMRAFLERISPTSNAHKITKPLFVVQGANDPRVPNSEAEQIVKAVRKGGRPVWYLNALDEGHGFRKKSNTVALLEAIGAFLRAHLISGSTTARSR